ncbi:MAG: metal-dependent transcriptional regulator, partial [Deltaproteobacteria bacterium]|nr:metal-dependent transcriptional regulator [Deltaproteobacteria bacterium]
KLLAEKGLINYAPYDIITLTPEGEQAAKDVVSRHQALSAFFVKILGLDAQAADDSACKLEHAVSSEILVRLTQFVAFVEQCPRAGVQWVEKFNSFCNAGGVSDGCKSCLDDCVKQHRPKEE